MSLNKNCSIARNSLCIRNGDSSKNYRKPPDGNFRPIIMANEGLTGPSRLVGDAGDLTSPSCSSPPSFPLRGMCEPSDSVCLGQRCLSGRPCWKFEQMLSSNSRPTSFQCPGDSKLFLPRNYISEYWSMELDIRNFYSVPKYGSFVYIFSSPRSIIPLQEGSMLEWEAVLYPKGVHFPAALMIGIPYSFDVPEYHQDSVRLSITCKTPLDGECRVDISVLVVAHTQEDEDHGVEYVDLCVSKSCIFYQERPCHNIDHILPIASLTDLPSKYVMPRSNGYFKLLVIIKPTEL